jgi:hypothetical protein
MPALRLLACLVAPLLACIEFERPTGETSEPPGSPTTGEDPPPPPKVNCDPLAQDCPDGEACTVADQEFVCLTVAVDGAAGDPCVVASECGVGLACCPASLLADCDAGNCCTPLCDVADAGADCPGAGESCTPIFTGPEVPLDIQNYGACKLPQ